jgi:hypothetical protein
MRQDKEHKISLDIRVSVPDGLLIPLDEPLTDQEREDMRKDSHLSDESLAAALEVCMFIKSSLESLGVTVEYSGVMNAYTV